MMVSYHSTLYFLTRPCSVGESREERRGASILAIIERHIVFVISYTNISFLFLMSFFSFLFIHTSRVFYFVLDMTFMKLSDEIKVGHYFLGDK